MKYLVADRAIKAAKDFLSPVTQIDCICSQPSQKKISWLGRKPGIFKNAYYPLEYQYLLDNHQYSLLLTDGSFFQFFYEFDNTDSLKKAKLAYYPKPISTNDSIETLTAAADEALEREDEELYEHIFNWVEYMELQKKPPSNTSHVRFDYDRSTSSHAPSHIQFSGIQEFRVPAEFYPLPLTFIELCLPILKIGHTLNTGDLSFESKNHHFIEKPIGSIFLTNAPPD